MREHPLLFRGAMVRGILRGQKTMTRRLVKLDQSGRAKRGGKCWHLGDPEVHRACPYGQPGDRLWVKETHCATAEGVAYRASPFHDTDAEQCRKAYGLKWTPSLLMPRIYSRILLEITAIRVERLQAISREDAISEGIEPAPWDHRWFLDYLDKRDPPGYVSVPQDSFRSLWQSINGIDSWDANPLVWVVEFRRVLPISVQSQPILETRS